MRFFNLLFWLIMGLAAGIGLLGAIAAAVLLTLPDVGELNGCLTTTMYHVNLCPSGSHYVRLKDISPMLIQAVVASEDAAFYTHHGFDWYEIEQSFKTNLEEKHIHRGGSTLTQQLAKNIWLTKDRSYWRKGKEAYLTYELEHKFNKDFILEKYLNVVEFGPSIFGVKDAAQHYFKKSPAQLHLLEAVFLAYLLPNPESYSKSFAKGELTPFGRKILSIILKRLVQFKKITPEAYQFALNEMPAFPWSGLTQADFENAHVRPAAPTEESTQDTQTIDQFLNEDETAMPDEAEPAVQIQGDTSPQGTTLPPEPEPTPAVDETPAPMPTATEQEAPVDTPADEDPSSAD